MKEFIEEESFSRLFLEGFSLLDVRSEGEFEDSAVPSACNIPILRNAERSAVGIIYREKGQESAIKLGHTLVTGETKRQRVLEWTQFLRKSEKSALFCARGGLRSKLSQEWIREAGIEVPRVRGGYKALRNFFLSLNDHAPTRLSPYIIGGRTGCGKTDLLRSISGTVPVIDLEAVARHRGSAFGDVCGGQPTQATFENTLALALLNIKSESELFLESESRRIGKNFIPLGLWSRMSSAPTIVLEATLEERIENIFRDYIEMDVAYPDSQQTVEQFGCYLLSALNSIGKHLGNERAKRIEMTMKEALRQQLTSGDRSLHRDWIRTILVEYYDPHYQKHLERYRERIIFNGDFNAVATFIRSGQYRASVSG